jgi:signal transduction histidine kinase
MAETQTNRELLQQAFPDLSNDLLATLEAAAVERTYPSDTILCRENQHEDTFYIIKTGEVVFSMLMGEEDRALRKGYAGEFFGEMALLDEKAGRGATVKTVTTTTVLELDRAHFDQLITASPTLVLRMAKIIGRRMRENDRVAIQELSEQKRQIEKAYDDLRRLHHQREIFLNTLAHELRTPLTSVTGYMQLIRGGHMTGPALQLSLEKMSAGLDRLVSLINDLFFLQQMETLEPRFRLVDLKVVLEEVLEKAKELADRQKVTLILNKDENLPELIAEADGLVRAFSHLVDNAIKFSPDGGEVVVNVRYVEGNVMVEVVDHGIGIDAAFMPHLFERFERDESYGKHLFGGAGVGLPIVKRIVEMHNGTIRVDSTRGEGTTFTIHLPLDARKSTLEMSIDDAWVDVPE